MSESKELKRIKNKYGEKFMHLCRELFPTILEHEGVLLKILESSFAGNSRTLGEDITEDLKEKFKSYILSKVEKYEKTEKKDIVEKTPYELLEEAGYDLYECKSEDDIQEFKKYYQPREELCTFNGGRLKSCIVFWAIKKDVNTIKREDFKNPKREDEYGTSVMSIQFSRGDNCTVSIKNRYNHTVNNPDATYGNDLDRIIPGLTQSFEKLLSERGMKLNSSNKEEFEIPNYTVASDGRYYKYNIEIDGIYYCPGNVIIEYGKIIKMNPDREMLIDYFILDKKNKTLKLYDNDLVDSFIDYFKKIEKIKITKNSDREKNTRIISIQTEDSKNSIKIEIDKDNNIVGYENHELKEVKFNFLCWNEKLKRINLSQLEKIGDDFLYCNNYIRKLDLPNLKSVGDGFLQFNNCLSQLRMPQLRKVGNLFLNSNVQLSQLSLPKVEYVGTYFLSENTKLCQLQMPQLKYVGDSFLQKNTQLTKLSLPQLHNVGDSFLQENTQLAELNLPLLERAGDCFLKKNIGLRELSLPFLKKVGNSFLRINRELSELSLPQLVEVGNSFLWFNKKLSELSLPKLEIAGDQFMYFNRILKRLSLLELKKVKNEFLARNIQLRELNLPMLEDVGDYFLVENNQLSVLNLPQLQTINQTFLMNNNNRQTLIKNMHKSPNACLSEVSKLDIEKCITDSEIKSVEKDFDEKDDLNK